VRHGFSSAGIHFFCFVWLDSVVVEVLGELLPLGSLLRTFSKRIWFVFIYRLSSYLEVSREHSQRERLDKEQPREHKVGDENTV